MSRLQQLDAKGIEPELPPLGPESYLVEYLYEAGPAMSGGMGLSALTWGEISDWQRLSGTPLQPWEARTLRMLSVEYVSSSRAAEEPSCPAPYSTEPTPDHRTRIANGLRMMLSGYSNPGRKAH